MKNVIESGGLFDSPSAGFLGYFVLLFFIALLLKRNDLQTILYWITFAWLTDFLVYTNLKSLNRYLYSRRNIANLPGKQIISTNRALMIAFSILALVVMLVVPLLPLDHIVYSIGIAIRDFLRWIFSHFSSEEQTVVETAAESLATSGQSAMFGDVKPTPAWLKMLYDILFAAILFVVSAGALVGIGYAILMLVHRFYKPSAVTGDIQEFINEETESSLFEYGNFCFGSLMSISCFVCFRKYVLHLIFANSSSHIISSKFNFMLFSLSYCSDAKNSLSNFLHITLFICF